MKRRQKLAGLSLTAVALQDHISRETGLLQKTKPVHGHNTKQDKPNLQEYVLDPQPPPLTLAQRLGLVDAPPSLLTEYQWNEIKQISNRRGDSTQPCPICQDEFRIKEQVLLSCTHTFHKSCLLAFERFSGRKVCPLCRHSFYETRVIHHASVIHKEKAATRIQAVWRGYKVRKWYTAYCESHPPINPLLRDKYYHKKLSSITDKLVKSCTETSESLDNFLLTIDNSLTESRHIMSVVDESSNISVDWKEISKKAQTFLNTDCAVCLSTLQISRSLTILSCSHLFHTSCITSLETFTLHYTPYLCPVCRTIYTRMHYSIQF